MPPTKLVLFLFVCLFSISASSQERTIRQDLLSADSVARNTEYHNDIYQLTRELTSPFNEDLLKARTIFIWITENLAYDYRLYNRMQEGKPPKGPVCKEGQDCDKVVREWEIKYLNKILKKKKAVCNGYSLLFKKMCEQAGLRAEIIPGYTKNKSYQVGSTGLPDHAWNAVWINNDWLLLDATWAAGGCSESESTGKLTGFKRMYNEYYWATSFEDLCRNHFPKESKWILKPDISKQKYTANPYIEGRALPCIQSFSPTTGMIEAKQGDTIHFRIKYCSNIRALQINSNIFRNIDFWVYKREGWPKGWAMKFDSLAFSKQRYVDFVKKGDFFFFDYIITSPSLEYLEVLFEYSPVMRYKVKVLPKDAPRAGSLDVTMIDENTASVLIKDSLAGKAAGRKLSDTMAYVSYIDSVLLHRGDVGRKWLPRSFRKRWIYYYDNNSNQLMSILQKKHNTFREWVVKYEFVGNELARMHFFRESSSKIREKELFFYVYNNSLVYNKNGWMIPMGRNAFTLIHAYDHIDEALRLVKDGPSL